MESLTTYKKLGCTFIIFEYFIYFSDFIKKNEDVSYI